MADDTTKPEEISLSIAEVLKEAVYSLLTGTWADEPHTLPGPLAGAAGAGKVKLQPSQAAAAAANVSAVAVSIAPFVREIVTTLMTVMGPVAANFLKAIGEGRRDGAGPINDVIVQAMGELLGVELSSADIPTGGDLQGNADRARAIGGKLHEVLLAEFTPGGTVTPESGEAAARAFTGFNINFGVTTAFIAIVAEMFSLGQLKEFRELGVTVAENLGLGRLHRMALKPLMDNTVSKPYDRLLRSRYRQDALSESQLVKAIRRGRITEEEARQALAEKGYKDTYIDEILSEFTPHLADVELERLVRHGVMTQADAIKEMQEDGWPADKAALKLQTFELARTDALVQAILAEYRTLVKHRFMDTETFHTLVGELPLTDEQKTWEIRLAGSTLDFSHNRITQAELTSMLEHGIVDLNYADEWAKGKGYSDADSLNLELLYFAKEKDKTAAAKAKADRAAAAAAAKAAKAAGKAPTTTPSAPSGG